MALRFQQLHFSRRFGRLASVEELMVESRLIGWAVHSDCQETLFGSLLTNEPSWPEMRALGVGFWFANMTQLRIRVTLGAIYFLLIYLYTVSQSLVFNICL